jgi:hypothetical protein
VREPHIAYKDIRELTVTARLNRSLNVADALDGYAVLVVAVDILVLELTNLVDQNTELVCDVRYVVVTGLTPDRELLLRGQLARYGIVSGLSQTYGDLHTLSGNQLHAAHHVLLHLDQL